MKKKTVSTFVFEFNLYRYTEEDAVISDSLNHASIIDGIRLCKAKRLRYDHANMEHLERRLVEAKGARVRLIATDGVFSMDGDVAPLREIVRLARRHDALVFVDESHATGFVGRGLDTTFHSRYFVQSQNTVQLMTASSSQAVWSV